MEENTSTSLNFNDENNEIIYVYNHIIYKCMCMCRYIMYMYIIFIHTHILQVVRTFLEG